jgi:hypothetical protein
MSGVVGHWNGTEAERDELLKAMDDNCACTYSEMTQARMTTCGAHQLLTGDQQALDRLLFARRIRDRLDAEEQSNDSPEPAA